MIKLLTSIWIVSILACTQTNTKQESGNDYSQTNSDWRTLEQSTYSVQYPSTWELNQSRQMGTTFVLFSPLESDKDTFKENVNLLIQDLRGQNIDLNRYTEISEAQIKSMVANSSLIESKRIKNGDDEYHKLMYSGDQGSLQLLFEQYYWVINDKAFVLTYTSEKAKFADYRETGEQILNSFKLKR